MKNNDAFLEFYDLVVAVVREIPAGAVATYGDIAKLAGYPKNARRVGRVMSHVYEDGVPCHRVVNSQGELSPEYIFHGRQKEMLGAEGVTFLENGKIDLKKHRWPQKIVKQG